jgi:phosphoglycolate phosphatase
MAKKQFDFIVFDWDGTLMDSTATIVKCIQAAAKDLGLPIPGDHRQRM